MATKSKINKTVLRFVSSRLCRVPTKGSRILDFIGRCSILSAPVFILLFTFCIFQTAEAASLYFNLNEKDVSVGEAFPLEILLDTEGKEVNAVEIKIDVQNDKIKIRDWSDGGSIINYWAKKPEIDEKGNLAFQGIMLGGFRGKDGKLLTLYCEALKTGEVTVNFQAPTTVYLNDGKGTKANLNFNGTAINILAQKAGAKSLLITDTTPPETLEIKISKSKDIFDGQYFLSFAAQDNGSGLDYVEIKEGDEPWVRAESPYLLKNQKIDKDVLVKAVDKNGNARIETVKLKQYQLIKNGIYAFGLILIFLAIWIIFRKRKPKIIPA